MDASSPIDPAERRAVRIWLLACTAVQLIPAAVRVLRPGILADNDSVAHYSWAWLLAHRQLPGGEGFFGWTSAFNTGDAFTLFNVPPLTSMLAWVLSLGGALPVLFGLKATLLIGYAALPALVYHVGRPLVGSRAGRFAAAAAVVVSCELFGLYFYFCNGMVNGALGLTLALAVIALGLRMVVDEPPRPSLIVALALATAACVLMHVQSCYMAVFFLACVIAAEALRRRSLGWLGRTSARLALGLGLGIGLCAFWILPSLPVIEPTAWVQVWMRPPWYTLRRLIDGQLLGGCVGFYPRQYHDGELGGRTLLCLAIFGLGMAVARARARGLVIATLASLWIMLGPTWAGPLRWLPGYDRLLHFRFESLFVLGCVLGAGVVLAALARGAKGRAIAVLPLLLLGWNAATTLPQIRTEADFPESRADLEAVSGWLRQHADPRARVFSEFLADVPDDVSVNYLRHMVPILSGREEVVGWVYENSPPMAPLLKHGVYWQTGAPMLDQNAAYNVKYVVLGSDRLRALAASDARWRPAFATERYTIFEAIGYQPDMLAGPPHRTLDWQQPSGHQYRLRYQLAAPGAFPLSVKVSWSPYWSATLDGRPVAVERDARGMIAVPEASRAPGEHLLALAWSAAAPLRRGAVLSALCAALLAGLATERGRRLLARALDGERTARALGLAAAGAALAALALSRPAAELRSPLAEGLEPWRSPDTVLVGAYGDTWRYARNHLIPGRWSSPALLDGRAGRWIAGPPGAAPDALVTVSGAVPVALSLDFVGFPELQVTIGQDSGAPPIAVRAGQPVAIPPAPIADGEDARRLGVWIRAPAPVHVSRLQVSSAILYLEAESLINAVDDDGADSRYNARVPLPSSNEVIATVAAAWPVRLVRLEKQVRLPAGRHAVWISAVSWRATKNYRLRAALDGASAGPPRAVPYSELIGFRWIRLGTVDSDGRAARFTLDVVPLEGDRFPWQAARADLDLVAIIPIPAGSTGTAASGPPR